MIRAHGLTRDFLQLELKIRAGRVRAVEDLTFEAEPGEIYGLLGPNGAGKTTALRLLSALLPPTAGSAIVAGYSVTEQPNEVRARVGLLTEMPGLYGRLTAAEYLDFFAQVHGLRNASKRDARVEELLRLVGLWDRRKQVMRGFSKGMQQRMAIARTLVQDPEVVLLDEPTAALDPEAARAIRDHVRELAAGRGRTVLLCTHNLFEAEHLCTRLSIIRSGRQIAEGTPAQLKAGLSPTCFIKVRERTPLLFERLSELSAIDAVSFDGPGTITFEALDPSAANPVVVRAAVAAGADVVGIGELGSSLEEAYLRLMNSPDVGASQ